MIRICSDRRWHPPFLATMLVFAGVCESLNAQGTKADAFTLGEVTITARRVAEPPGEGRIDKADMWCFDTPTLDQAVKLVPGVSATFDSNGRRNERDIFIRGFGRLQIPLSIDGVRVYLPADNRLDFNRFLTPDLAAIQIQKGFVPVGNGPGGLGGAINLVTRKPLEPFEFELQSGSLLGRNADDRPALFGPGLMSVYAAL